VTFDVETFAAQRDRALLDLAATLRPRLAAALSEPALAQAVLDVLADPFRRLYEGEGGNDWRDAFASLRGDLDGALARTTPQTNPDLLATWLATAVLNRATVLAAPLLSVKQWLCVSGDTLVQAPGVTHVSRRWHEGWMIRLRLPHATLTLTPEHHVLTGRGWVAAQALDEQDKVFHVAGVDAVGTPGVEHSQPSIKECFDALAGRSLVEQRRTMKVPMDLDGHVASQEVDVVAADSRLRHDLQAACSQALSEFAFQTTDVQLALLACASPRGQLLGRPPSPDVDRAQVGGDTLTLARPLTADEPGFAVGSHIDTGECQLASDGARGHVVGPGDGSQGLPAGVSPCDVLSIEVIPWSDHVYDLSVTSSWFVANGTIVHNSMQDEAVRDTHRPLHGVRRLRGETFPVGGFALQYPGQPVGPPEVWINCVAPSTKVGWAGQGVLAITRHVTHGRSVHLRLIDGRDLTVTPNHPVLTPEGYVKADLLRPGDEVMAAPLSVGPQVADVEPSAEQLFRAMSKVGVVERVGVAAVDFHGDVPDEEVQVVWADGDLAAELRVQGGDQALVRLGVREVTFSDASLLDLARGEGVALPASSGAARGMGGGGVGTALLGRHAGHAQPVGLAGTAGFQPEPTQVDVDGASLDAEFPRHLEDALALGMAATQVVGVERGEGRHEWYNLHTDRNWYSANGVVTHNCRCVLAVLPFTNIADAFSLEFAEHDLLFLENRRTPKVVPRGQRYTPKPSEGRITKRRHATKDEERVIARDDWLRVNQDGKKPGQPGYMDRRSKVRPQLNAVERAEQMADTDVMDDIDTDEEFDVTDFAPDEPTPWYGVLAPEGVLSGDKRSFEPGALSSRDLPLPLLWQPSNESGHDGAVVVGRIDRMDRDPDGLVWGEGVFAQTEEADKVVGLIAEGHLRGISVDVDDAEMAVTEDESVRFSKGRISAATIVPIPAFAEAFIALGTRQQADDLVAAAVAMRDYTQAERDRMTETGEALDDGSYPIKDADDLRNAIQAVGRAKDYEKAKRHIMRRARALDLEWMLPEEWAGDTEEFKRGAGWVTHPEETRRLHAYWTRGKGAAKIRWGMPGDFTRCTRQLAKYVNPYFLYRTCAQWHHDALGYWPGELGRPGNPPNTPENRRRAARHATALQSCEDCVPQGVSLVSAAAPVALPADAFADPHLPGPTGLTVEPDGRIRGHLALWDTCHIGIDRMCVTPPHSAAQYAYFSTGQVLTDDGYVPVGQITLDTGHADLSADPFAAKAHYDNTGTVVADVAVGEDEHGIWFAGMLRPDVDDAAVHRLLASGLSGDWRGIRGNLELVAALAVNVPGFPVPRLAASGGRQTALITPPALAASAQESEVVVDVHALAVAVLDEMAARARRAQRVDALASFADEDRRARARALMEVR